MKMKRYVGQHLSSKTLYHEFKNEIYEKCFISEESINKSIEVARLVHTMNKSH